MTCPDEGRWTELASGHPDPALLAHADACGTCRRLLAGALAALDPAALPEPLVERALTALPRRRIPWLWAAAAALLLSVAIWRPKPAVVPTPPSPAADSRYRFLPPGTTIRLSADARMEGLDLRSGSALVSTDAGAVTVGIPPGKVRIESGTVLIEPEEVKTAFLLRDALAAETAWRITVLEGEALLLPDRKLKAGDSARWMRGSSPEPAPPQAARTPFDAIPETGWRTDDLPGDRYVLEALLAPESMPPEGDVGIAYRVGDLRDVWWLRGGLTRSALGFDPLSGKVRVRIVVDREVTVFVNGKACGRIPLSAVKDAGGTGALRTTRGKVRTERLRWRSLE